MGKRGPTAKGEYLDKSRVLSTRISAELRGALTAAAEGRTTLSREIEHRLRRTFIEDKQIEAVFGNRRMFQLMRLIASVIDSTVHRKILDSPKKPSVDWMDDPYAFDQAVRAAVAVFNLIRPPGDVPRTLDEALDQYGGTFQGEFNTVEALREIQRAPDALPLKGSRHQQKMAGLKKDIGDLAERARTYGQSADAARKTNELARKLAVLRKKQVKLGGFDQLPIEDRKQMDDIAGEIEQLQRGESGEGK